MRLRSCFLLILLSGAGHALVADVLYRVTDLGTLSGYSSGRALIMPGK
ncbi:MAG TPA: hypothetical protein VLJ11_12860 [Bryobacteraceae bacterium]|nr:hypothetical protein [Bryobacteraceae bacterium]